MAELFCRYVRSMRDFLFVIVPAYDEELKIRPKFEKLSSLYLPFLYVSKVFVDLSPVAVLNMPRLTRRDVYVYLAVRYTNMHGLLVS